MTQPISLMRRAERTLRKHAVTVMSMLLPMEIRTFVSFHLHHWLAADAQFVNDPGATMSSTNREV